MKHKQPQHLPHHTNLQMWRLRCWASCGVSPVGVWYPKCLANSWVLRANEEAYCEHHIDGIYDPIGILSPFVIRLKMFLQKICIAKLDCIGTLRWTIEKVEWVNWRSSRQFPHQTTQTLFQWCESVYAILDSAMRARVPMQLSHIWWWHNTLTWTTRSTAAC
jgi:hypothetical protein